MNGVQIDPQEKLPLKCPVVLRLRKQVNKFFKSITVPMKRLTGIFPQQFCFLDLVDSDQMHKL